MRDMIDIHDNAISIREQCSFLEFNRSSYYYEPKPVSADTLKLMHSIDEIYTKHPYYGNRRMVVTLGEKGFDVGRDRVRSAMHAMGLRALYPQPNLSKHNPEHRIYPYLLKGYTITRPGEVYSSDITYIRLLQGFIYLVAIIDWYSRYVLSWRISTSLDLDFCIDALLDALGQCYPIIFNTDQGSQFTSIQFTGELSKREIKISMDGRGRALDNVFVERLWRSVKYEDVYIKGYESVRDAYSGLKEYFHFYNTERPHQSLGYRTPADVHYNGKHEYVSKC